MDAADAIVQEGKKAKTHDEIESCYTKLKVWFCIICMVKRKKCAKMFGVCIIEEKR